MAFIGRQLPRKPLTAEEQKQNSDNRIRAQHVMALYSTREAELRSHLEREFRVAFEYDSDGHPYVDEKKLYGEFDFDNFTHSDWDEWRLMKAITQGLIERMRVTWPDVSPKGERGSSGEEITVTFRQARPRIR